VIKIEVNVDAHVDIEETFRKDLTGVNEMGGYRYSLRDVIENAVRNWILVVYGVDWESETEIWVVPVEEREKCTPTSTLRRL